MDLLKIYLFRNYGVDGFCSAMMELVAFLSSLNVKYY